MKPITVTIPTYWKRKLSESPQEGDSVFDHPTALDGPETLTRTLESLSQQIDQTFQVILIVATVCPDIHEAVEKRINDTVAPFKQFYPIIQFGFSDLQYVNRCLSEKSESPLQLSLENYANIRNCQLAISAACQSDIVVAIDDDETVQPDFLRRAVEHLGDLQQDKRIHGKTGLYYHEWGDYLLKESEDCRNQKNLFDRKAAMINDGFTHILSRPGRLVDTAISLGGNMVFSRELFENVPFDPNITRGEDIDYLINSKCLGYHWVLDKELRIDHFPPPGDHGSKLQEDVTRFIYEKQKLLYSQSNPGIFPVTAEKLDPYPGEYLKPGIEDIAREALDQRDGSVQKDPNHLSTDKVIELAEMKAEKVGDYFDFANKWPGLMGHLRNDQEVFNYFQSKF